MLNSVTESLNRGTKISWEMGMLVSGWSVTSPAPNLLSILIFIMTTFTLLSASVTYFKHISHFNLLLCPLAKSKTTACKCRVTYTVTSRRACGVGNEGIRNWDGFDEQKCKMRYHIKNGQFRSNTTILYDVVFLFTWTVSSLHRLDSCSNDSRPYKWRCHI